MGSQYGNQHPTAFHGDEITNEDLLIPDKTLRVNAALTAGHKTAGIINARLRGIDEAAKSDLGDRDGTTRRGLDGGLPGAVAYDDFEFVADPHWRRVRAACSDLEEWVSSPKSHSVAGTDSNPSSVTRFVNNTSTRISVAIRDTMKELHDALYEVREVLFHSSPDYMAAVAPDLVGAFWTAQEDIAGIPTIEEIGEDNREALIAEMNNEDFIHNTSLSVLTQGRMSRLGPSVPKAKELKEAARANVRARVQSGWDRFEEEYLRDPVAFCERIAMDQAEVSYDELMQFITYYAGVAFAPTPARSWWLRNTVPAMARASTIEYARNANWSVIGSERSPLAAEINDFIEGELLG